MNLFFVFVCFFSLQYSEKALYNQLSFYRFIFDWEYAVNKVLQGDEKSKKTHCAKCGRAALAIFNPH